MTRYLLRGLAAAGAAMILCRAAGTGDSPPMAGRELLRAERRLIDMLLRTEQQLMRERLSTAACVSGGLSSRIYLPPADSSA